MSSPMKNLRVKNHKGWKREKSRFIRMPRNRRAHSFFLQLGSWNPGKSKSIPASWRGKKSLMTVPGGVSPRFRGRGKTREKEVNQTALQPETESTKEERRKTGEPLESSQRENKRGVAARRGSDLKKKTESK